METVTRYVDLYELEAQIHGMYNMGWRVASMTTITDWQPLPNVPKERVFIVFEKESNG